jgi:hypothetical protein
MKFQGSLSTKAVRMPSMTSSTSAEGKASRGRVSSKRSPHAAALAVGAAMAAALTFAPAQAQAQDWLKDRKYTEGIGYRVGDFELHPGVGAEFGYDSNYFHRSGEDGGGAVGALRFRITPSLSLSTLSAQRRDATPGAPPPDFEFRAGVSATYNEFIPTNGPQSGKDTMSKQRNLGGELNLDLQIRPNRPWSGSLYGGIARQLTPSQDGVTTVSFNRLAPRVGGELAFAPGGGLFDWRLGYGFSGTVFESGNYSNLTNLQHDITTRGRWRFLPRTAFLYDAKFGFISYPNSTGKTSSHPMRAQLGLNGLITPSFGLMAMAGWGASFYTPTGQEDFNSVIGRLELKWYITPNPSTDPGAATLTLSSLAIGFNRDFYDSYIGTYYERDRGYATLSYFFGGKFLLVLDGGAGPIVYPDITQPVKISSFSDVRVDASLFGEYRIRDSVGINGTVRYGGNLSKTAISVQGSKDDLAWQQVEAYLGVRWFM